MTKFQKNMIGFIFGIFFLHQALGLESGFVYLDEIDSTIVQSMRYTTCENFVGTPIDGYHCSRIIMTHQAAVALQKAQEIFQKRGYFIVVYDAYRPQRGVNHFMRWSKDVSDQKMKDAYYPRVNKADVFDLGFVAEKSGHSRGSTVDISLIPLGEQVQNPESQVRQLKDGFSIIFLNDRTVDMGTSFDLFDESSHYETNLISQEHQEMRRFLKETMEDCGFKNYAEEWWHFTLKDEPFPTTYFDFPIQ